MIRFLSQVFQLLNEMESLIHVWEAAQKTPLAFEPEMQKACKARTEAATLNEVCSTKCKEKQN